MASAAECPVVITSSTTTTAAPGLKQPSMRCPVPWGLGLLAHAEGVEGHSLSSGGGGHGVGDGIGAEGQPADQIGRPPAGGEAREPESADHDEAFAGHGGAARIDVEGGAAPGREGELSARD